MAVFKCKMCGGDLDVVDGMSVAECEYCGTKQTLPKLNDNEKEIMYERAGHFRRNNEFDKAMGIYEKILDIDNTDAEAYWSLVLCEYGIEYVEDPSTHKRVPTVNRAQFTSVFMNENYKSAIRYADAYQRSIYEEEAKNIDNIQKGILEISQNEEPFDVFICYKETDEHGRRTHDSVLANDLYHQLTQEGFKVFFARITLEDKLGTAYEPYIFAALNSAKVMVVIGTKPEYFNAVWVKNEWARFLAQIKNDADKILIPAYKDMDPYDLPIEFSNLQAQDMSKLGFMQDIIRGIKKLTATEKKEFVRKENVVESSNVNINALLRRITIFLEDGEWATADEYCEKVLDLDAENPQAYIGKLMAKLRIHKQEQLGNQRKTFTNDGDYAKALRFADDETASKLKQYALQVEENIKNDRLEEIYNEALRDLKCAHVAYEFKMVAEKFEKLGDYKDSIKNMEFAQKECTRLEDECKSCEEEWKRVTDEQKKCIETLKKELCQQENEQKSKEHEIHSIITNNENKIAELKKTLHSLGIFKQKEKKAIREEIAKYENKNREFYDNLSEYTKVFAKKIREYEYKIEKCKGEIKQESMKVLYQYRLLNDYEEYKTKAENLTYALNYHKTMAGGDFRTVGLRNDGTVVIARDNDNTQDEINCWKDIMAVAAGWHTVGLKKDGTVVSVGDNYQGECNVSDWRDIVSITAVSHRTVGLKKDGTVVAIGYNEYKQCNVSDWRDIVAIAASNCHTVGLKKDGTVVAVGSNEYKQCNVSDWKDIVSISAGDFHTVGLKKDGTVISVGDNADTKNDIGGWKDIIAIAAGGSHTAGLKNDGTVVAVGYDHDTRCNVDDWKDVIAVSTGFAHTVGLKKNGTVIAAGDNYRGECNVGDWKDIKIPNNIQ